MSVVKVLGLGTLGAVAGFFAGSAIGYASGWTTAELGQHVINELPVIGTRVDFSAATKDIIKSYATASGGFMGTIYGGINGLAVGLDSDLTYLSRKF